MTIKERRRNGKQSDSARGRAGVGGGWVGRGIKRDLSEQAPGLSRGKGSAAAATLPSVKQTDGEGGMEGGLGEGWWRMGEMEREQRFSTQI